MTPPMTTRSLFVTPLYEASLAGEKGFETFIDELHAMLVRYLTKVPIEGTPNE